MNPQELFQANLDIYKVWIETSADLQPSNDLIAPLIPYYEKSNPGISINHACHDCIIDMLRWYNKENKTLPTVKVLDVGEVINITPTKDPLMDFVAVKPKKESK